MMNIDYSLFDDITVALLADDGDVKAQAECRKRLADETKTFDVGVEATLVQGDYSQRVFVKSARGDGYYQVENVATGKTGWVSSTDLE